MILPSRVDVSIFQSTLSMRRATLKICDILRTRRFQSTLSMRRATHHVGGRRQSSPISIHALHEESDQCRMPASTGQQISIHALHEESDSRHQQATVVDTISIHALHEESDLVISASDSGLMVFQSTLSMRRATFLDGRHVAARAISIHALHEESDAMANYRRGIAKFQSTLSMRRATSRRVGRAHQGDFNPRSP